LGITFSGYCYTEMNIPLASKKTHMRAIDIIGASDDHRQVERLAVAVYQHLGRSLGRRVRIGRRQQRVFRQIVLKCLYNTSSIDQTHLMLLNFAVHFIRRDMDESLDVADTSDLEEDMGAHDVVDGEVIRIAKRIIDMRLRRKVHNRIDVAFIHNKTDKIRDRDVALRTDQLSRKQ
jgi:hypothetical protein